MEAQLHQTREAWLHHVAQCMGRLFEKFGAPLPAQLRIAIGFTSSGRRSRNIGECWDNQCSEDRHFEIFIRPDLSESKDLLPMQVAAILGHELVHAAVGVATRHGKEFRRVARGIGLVGRMAATTAGPEFEQAMRPILEAAGPLPHGRLQLAIGASSHSNRRKKPSPGRSSAPVAIAATLFIRRVNGSNWPEHHCAPSTVKWTYGRCHLGRRSSEASPASSGAEPKPAHLSESNLCCRLTSNRSADAFTFATLV